MIKYCKFWLMECELSPNELGKRLNETLMSVIATKAQGYEEPRRALLLLLQQLEDGE